MSCSRMRFFRDLTSNFFVSRRIFFCNDSDSVTWCSEGGMAEWVFSILNFCSPFPVLPVSDASLVPDFFTGDFSPESRSFAFCNGTSPVESPSFSLNEALCSNSDRSNFFLDVFERPRGSRPMWEIPAPRRPWSCDSGSCPRRATCPRRSPWFCRRSPQWSWRF